MFDIVLRRDDTLPKIQKTLYVNGAPFNLTGYTVEFVVTDIIGTELIREAASFLTDGTDGIVTYQWTVGDSTAMVSDIGLARFVATMGSDVFTVPNNSPLTILLTDNDSSEYSYTGDPASRPIDEMRFLLGDTDMGRALFTDKELTYLLSKFSNPYSAAAEGALTFAARYTDLRDKTVGPLSIRYGSIINQWEALAKSLQRRGSKNNGALAITTQRSCEPAFSRGMNDFPESQLFDWQNVQGGPPA